jgi:hypothetical protein
MLKVTLLIAALLALGTVAQAQQNFGTTGVLPQGFYSSGGNFLGSFNPNSSSPNSPTGNPGQGVLNGNGPGGTLGASGPTTNAGLNGGHGGHR